MLLRRVGFLHSNCAAAAGAPAAAASAAAALAALMPAADKGAAAPVSWDAVVGTAEAADEIRAAAAKVAAAAVGRIAANAYR